jgi:hypothetical protein
MVLKFSVFHPKSVFSGRLLARVSKKYNVLLTKIRYLGGMGDFKVPPMELSEFSAWLEAHRSQADISGSLYAPDISDLYSLYLSIRISKSIAVIEYGSGWSTLVLTKGIYENLQEDRVTSRKYSTFVLHPNPFRVLTIDASKYFQDLALERLDPDLREILTNVVANVKYGTFLDRVCTYFDFLPAFTADFIYLDGPDCDQIQGNFNGFDLNFGTSEHRYGLPMAADILRFEHFIWSGTQIIIDGRGANANFLRTNFVRNWSYNYNSSLDQHEFLLKDEPWGEIVKNHLYYKKN